MSTVISRRSRRFSGGRRRRRRRRLGRRRDRAGAARRSHRPGPEHAGTLDFVMELEQKASAQGGRVVSLLGNHEVMNMTGDLRYVTAGNYAEFADAGSEKRRADAWSQVRALRKRRARKLGQPEPALRTRSAGRSGSRRTLPASSSSGRRSVPAARTAAGCAPGPRSIALRGQPLCTAASRRLSREARSRRSTGACTKISRASMPTWRSSCRRA